METGSNFKARDWSTYVMDETNPSPGHCVPGYFGPTRIVRTPKTPRLHRGSVFLPLGGLLRRGQPHIMSGGVPSVRFTHPLTQNTCDLLELHLAPFQILLLPCLPSRWIGCRVGRTSREAKASNELFGRGLPPARELSLTSVSRDMPILAAFNLYHAPKVAMEGSPSGI
jgi:hypothetical protein